MASSSPFAPSLPTFSVLASSDYIDEMYSRWQENPEAVAEEWRLFFTGFDLATCPRSCVAADRARAQSKVASIIYGYRSLGHLIADVNPLVPTPSGIPELELSSFDLEESDLDQVFDAGHLGGIQRATLRDIIAHLHVIYCHSIGVEYLHMQSRQARRWLQAEMEPIRNQPNLSNEQRIAILEQLVDAELFETFIHSRYPGQKRFSLEGSETLIPTLHAFMRTAIGLGVEEVVMGMAHRGRLNVLANILGKPYQLIFHEFEDTHLPEQMGGDGDVKYHRGYDSFYELEDGRRLHISLTANPSHLEAVYPVVEGRTRAKQRRRADTEERARVIPLLLHGDAAFAGQGLVAETLNLSQLQGYRTGGTLHLIVNNQIGFTTTPEEARSFRYPTDVAKMLEAPIFHVNGEDPEAVVHVISLALRFRQEFKRDVVVDIISYRRHGHNEGDEPAFTQPRMYEMIRKRPSIRQLYQERLMEAGVIDAKTSEQIQSGFQERLKEAFESVKISCPVSLTQHAFDSFWKDYDHPYDHAPAATATSHPLLARVARAMTTVPDGFSLHRKVARRLPDVAQAVREHGTVDWSTAELLAFGSLLAEGNPVRLSGQDSERGTFSNRHAVWFDTNTQEPYTPLNHIDSDQARFCVYNSALSEAAVLGFDYGYSLVDPEMLVIWEAQFGDFANGAQVIIDQFIAASLDKWQRASGLVMLLPHGYEGQGPEHSNAYLERYLTLCAESNMQVINLTTPAQYFHVLRRQLRRPFRRPLVIMSPKSMLRHKLAVSPVDELVDGRFHEILDDPRPPKKPRRLVLCSGKMFYDLLAARERDAVDDVAVVRLEQIYPLHQELLDEVIEPYRSAKEVLWVQEEPRNRGCWSHLACRFLEIFAERVRYVGRAASASPATGSAGVHREKQEAIVTEALTG
jgi:2-oxoglutarate dehydrogenase E1 component